MAKKIQAPPKPNRAGAIFALAILSVAVFLLLNPGGALDIIKGYEALISVWLTTSFLVISLILLTFPRNPESKAMIVIALIIFIIIGIVIAANKDALEAVEGYEGLVYLWSTFAFLCITLFLLFKKNKNATV